MEEGGGKGGQRGKANALIYFMTEGCGDDGSDDDNVLVVEGKAAAGVVAAAAGRV